MKTLINGRVILPNVNGDFVVEENKTINFEEKIISIGGDSVGEIIDAKNFFVAPGFINVHIHGCAGADVMDEDGEALKKICEFLPKTGVTSFLPTTMTMPKEKIRTALQNIRSAKNLCGAKILGVHLEGPFVSKKFKGAQAEENILPPDFNLIDEFKDIIKIVTVAPEELSDFDFIKKCRKEKIIFSIGHSAADYETAAAAISHGASHITHLFNAQSGLHHRKPNVVGAALDSDAIIELIADNVHVHPVLQRIVKKLKPKNEIILITDSLRACGLGDGESELGGQKVFVRGNIATLADGTIAASVAKMNDVVKNFCVNTKSSVAETVELVTKNPAVELGIYDKLGSVEVGKSADFTIFDDGFNIKFSIVNGEILSV